eukprot:COSAG01_NODE_1271_length_10961_cov_555.935739_1_plen_96_part_00
MPEHIAASIIFHRLRNNEDLATHDGLCTTHHVQLNIDKNVERLTKRDGKSTAVEAQATADDSDDYLEALEASQGSSVLVDDAAYASGLAESLSPS